MSGDICATLRRAWLVCLAFGWGTLAGYRGDRRGLLLGLMVSCAGLTLLAVSLWIERKHPTPTEGGDDV